MLFCLLRVTRANIPEKKYYEKLKKESIRSATQDCLTSIKLNQVYIINELRQYSVT